MCKFGHIYFNGWKLVIFYSEMSPSMLQILVHFGQKQIADYLDIIGYQIEKGKVDKNGNIWPNSITFNMNDYRARGREWCKFDEDWTTGE